MMSFGFVKLQNMFRSFIALTLSLQVGWATADSPSAMLLAQKPTTAKAVTPSSKNLLQLVGLATPQGMRVWAVRADTGEPLAGVKLLAKSQRYSAGRVVNELKYAAVKTNAQGLALLLKRDSDRLNVQGTILIDGQVYTSTLVEGANVSWTRGIERSRALIQTDKSIYRPGEQVRGFAILRQLDVGQRKPWLGKSKVKLVSPKLGLTLAQTELDTNTFGVLRYSLPLPSNVEQGQYELVVETPTAPTKLNPKPLPNQNRLPIYVQSVASAASLSLNIPTEVITDTSWPFEVIKTVANSNGQGKEQAQVFLLPNAAKQQQGTSRSALWFQSVQSQPHLTVPDWKKMPKALAVLPFQAQKESQKKVATSSLKLSAEPKRPRKFTLVARTQDSFGSDIWVQRQIVAYPAALKIQVDQAPTWGTKEVHVGASVRHVGKNTLASGVEVSAELLRVTAQVGSKGTQVASQQEKLLEQKQKTDAQGLARFTLSTKDMSANRLGNYVVRLKVKDAAGRELHQSIPLQAQQPQPLWVGLDKAQYKAGEVAKLHLRTNLPKGTKLLLSAYAEARTISKLLKVVGPNMKVDWPVVPEMAPAFELQAIAVQKGQVLKSQSAFALAPQSEQRVQVELKAGPEVRPGQPTTVSVQTTQNGQPVAASVLLSGTNKKLYEAQPDLSPDPWRFFWGATQPQVKLQTMKMQSTKSVAQGNVSKSRMEQNVSVAPFFPSHSPTLSFLQTATTNVSGKATLKLRMPNASGEYRLNVRAFTPNGAIGQASTIQKVGRPFVLKLGFPRVLSFGDTSQVQMNVTDRDNKAGQVKLSLSAQGQTQTEQVAMKQGLAQKGFGLKVPTEGAGLRFEAQAVKGKNQEKQRYTIPLRLVGNERVLTSRGRVTAGVPYNDLLTVPKGSKVKSLQFDMALTPLQLALTNVNTDTVQHREVWNTTDVLAASVRSNIHLHALATKYGWQDVQASALNKVRNNLVNLMAFGQKDGWGWTAIQPVKAEMTGLVLLTLLQAKELPVVDQATIDMVYQQALRLAQKTTPVDPTLAAALAQAGKPQYALTLAQKPTALKPVLAARLAISLAQSHPGLAKKVYQAARKSAKETKKGTLLLGDPKSYQGQDEATAILLQAATVVQESGDIAALTAALLDLRKGGGWEGSLATAEALAALRPQATSAGRRLPSKVVIQFPGWKKAFDLSTPIRFDIPIEQVKPGPFLIESTGALAFSRALRVQTSQEQAPPRDTIVDRKYERLELKKGDIIQVTLTVSTDNPKANLRVVDPIPGGLEIVSEPIETNAAPIKWAGRSFFDDRAVFYVEKLNKGSTVLQYKLRARASGQYTAPGSRIEFAGSPIQIKGRAQKIVVK